MQSSSKFPLKNGLIFDDPVTQMTTYKHNKYLMYSFFILRND